MMKRIIALLLLTAMLTLIFAACASQREEIPREGPRTYADFAGKRIGHRAGSI